MTLHHGGRLHEAARIHGIPHADWLDLSAAINPAPWPAPALPGAIWNRLPDDSEHLHLTASRYYGSDQLLAVNGSQQAINVLPWLRPRGTVLLFTPGYQEHAANWQAAGHCVDAAPVEQRTDVLHSLVQRDAPLPDVLVLINPHNPTGDVIDDALLAPLQQRFAESGGWLVVDEAFADGGAAPTCIRPRMPEGLIVLRSTGKFFGLPGLRGGFVFAAPQLLAALAERIGPWPQSTAAQYLLPRAFDDTAWQQQAVAALAAASHRMKQLFEDAGFNLTAGTPLFQTIDCGDIATAVALHQRLARTGVLTRHYAESPYIRFGLPATGPGWQRLEHALPRKV